MHTTFKRPRSPRLLGALAAVLAVSLAAPRPAIALDEQTAIFAGGCFWCVESDFDTIPGVLETVSGYTGGTLDDPTYKAVTQGGTGHYEAVRITFDADTVSYTDLVAALFRSVDPTDAGGQFCDRGPSYRTAIFATDAEQRRIAEREKAQAAVSLDTKIATPILDAATFYPAEDYHQDFYEKSPTRYTYYRWSCGRDDTVKRVWGKEAFKGIPGKG
ncbi:peptide-methionine (S)-S-oxide reductase MsrA [Stappia sp. ES.058]|uniref:peptide-methionine (S)-S-oxide reductase MsrA n=1 Tax=Stappia sp. ES.058 TaxID=1881061 RepID=UPI00087D5423|nr:peptide-methionine (S)-S-oxide reductase MsrA [Stappia sp. ES.058]SDT89946.1 peptide-methionine (S)-S-oxide reductase [Stappia sp. ES.058]